MKYLKSIKYSDLNFQAYEPQSFLAKYTILYIIQGLLHFAILGVVFPLNDTSQQDISGFEPLMAVWQMVCSTISVSEMYNIKNHHQSLSTWYVAE